MMFATPVHVNFIVLSVSPYDCCLHFSFLTPDRIFSLIQNNIDISDVSYFLRLPVKLVDFTVQGLPQINSSENNFLPSPIACLNTQAVI